jgi:hypothetical protein
VRGSKARYAAALLLCVLVSACGVSRLQFTNDHRLSFQSPQTRELVRVPLTIRWSMRDFEPVGLDGSADEERGAFAVFVDRAPMPVGKDLDWLAKGDRGCQRDPRCPDAKYLADRGVYVTTATSLTLDVLPAAPDGVGDEQHYVNVVLVDGTGHRIGESAWYRAFTSTRRGA